MRRFEFFGCFSFHILAVVSFSVWFTSMAMAVTVGFYAGTFDPPTSGEIVIVRCAFGDSSVHKECQNIGKTISRVVVSVNQPNNDDPLASTRERVLMVKKALQQETEALLLDWKSKSVAAMDVEGLYLAMFATRHSDLIMSAFFAISDQTLGDSTIDESESRLNVIDDSVYKLVAFLLPKILTPK